jgi:hypothetical protein
MDLKEVEWGMGWIYLAEVRDRYRVVVNAVINHRTQQNARNFLTR